MPWLLRAEEPIAIWLDTLVGAPLILTASTKEVGLTLLACLKIISVWDLLSVQVLFAWNLIWAPVL